MKKKLKNYLKRFFLAGASVFSFLAGGYIIMDLYILGYNNVKHMTMTFLAFALIFICFTMLILADDLYKVKK